MIKKNAILLSALLILVFVIFSGCATKMSLDEAKKATVSIQKKPFVPPPRTVNDILVLLDSPGKFYSTVTADFKARANAKPASDMKRDDLRMFYRERGLAARMLGRYNQALDDERAAFRLAQEAGFSDPDTDWELGLTEVIVGNYQSALELILKAGTQIKYDASVSYYKWALLSLTMGDFESAKQAEKKCQLLCAQPPMGWRTFCNANLAGIQAWILSFHGKHAEAETYIREMMGMWYSAVDKRPAMAIRSRLFLAGNLLNQNRFVEAELEMRQVLKEALGFSGRDSAMTGEVIGVYAKILQRQGRLGDAEKLSLRAIRILESAGVDNDSMLVGSQRMILADILIAKGNIRGAVQQYDLNRESMKANQHLYDRFFALNPNIPLAMLRIGRTGEAMKVLAYSCEEVRKRFGETHPIAVQMQALRAIAYAMSNNDRLAYRDFASSIPMLLKNMLEKSEGYSDGRQRIRMIMEGYIDFLVKIRGTPFEKETGIDASAEAFKAAGMIGSSSVQSALSDSTARAAASYDLDLADLVRREQDTRNQITALRTTLSNLLSTPSNQRSDSAIKDLRNEIETFSRARSALLEEISKRFPKYAHFINPQPVLLSVVRESLRPGESLIYLYTSDDRTYIWAIPYEGEGMFFFSPLGKKEAAQIVAKLRNSLDSHPSTLGDIPAFDLSGAYALYEKVLKPVEPVWKRSSDLLVITSGPLGQIPFSLLPTAPVMLGNEKDELFVNYRPVPWLIRKVSVTMLPSINSLLTLRTIPAGDANRKAFAGFGDPIFNLQQLAQTEVKTIQKEESIKSVSHSTQFASRGVRLHVRGVRISEKGNLDSKQIDSSQLDQLDRLPDTAEEIKNIARALDADPMKDVFIGKEASKHRVKTMHLSDRKVIAFATHALVPGDLDGLDQPALALSPSTVTGHREDGLLTMDEILRLKLNADWVVLSACNTGAAEGQGAETISGLGRAFFYAGTRALLVTMWPVETTSARILVSETFRYQKEGGTLTRARALQKSMLHLIDRATFQDDKGVIIASYAHPLFWAPFVIVGDPGR